MNECLKMEAQKHTKRSPSTFTWFNNFQAYYSSTLPTSINYNKHRDHRERGKGALCECVNLRDSFIILFIFPRNFTECLRKGYLKDE